jgi:hypothetical protein
MTRNSILALFTVTALSVAACTSGEGGGDVASLAPTSSDAVGSAEADGSVDAEEAMLAFTQCLRDGGIDIDDPIIDENGNPQLPPIEDQTVVPDGGDFEPDATMKAMDDVMAGCQHHLDGLTFNATEHGDLVDIQDTFVAYAQCMRDHGIDMPDPDFSAGGMIDLSSADPSDDGYEEAHGECKEVFTGSGIDLPGF